MIFAGVDIGSTTTKAVVLDGDAGPEGEAVRASALQLSGNLPGKTAKRVYLEALGKAGLGADDVAAVATTGYGRRLADFGDLVLTEIKACAAGVRFAPPPGEAVHTIIDVGGQDTKVIALSDEGDIEDFSMNDKCAAGTGRFLEMLAGKLDLSYEEFVAAALKSETMIQMNATCAVFAESEVVGLLARNVEVPDIAAAAHNAIAGRIASMTRRVGQRGAFCFVGGGARNAALVRAVTESLNKPVHVARNAQLVVALGAALGARRRYQRLKEKESL